MPAHDPADARTALMATYFARYACPQAGAPRAPIAASSAPLRQYDANVCNRRLPKEKPPPEGFAARGRTIYNADWAPAPVTLRETKQQGQHYSALSELQRIDAEEERRKTLGYEFLMAARGDFNVENVEVHEGQSYTCDDERRAQEMFELYIRMED